MFAQPPTQTINGGHPRSLKANSHVPCRSHAMPFPYHAVLMPCRSAKGLDCVFPIWFTQCGHVWFKDAMPFLCRSESDLSKPRHSAAWERHGMCELESAIQRCHVGDLPTFDIFRLPCGVPRRLLAEPDSQWVRTRPKPSDFSDEKIHSIPSFRGELKPSVPCKRTLRYTWKSESQAKLTGHFLAQFRPSLALTGDDRWN
jgi:hypothetical protein